ncbi:hypothetical protein JD844_008860 [Phrynosoma platyrhinos]|uniref:Inositol hexakisphosphate and diphosphoinositol-pentakisphosphate kinase n=1 Tax=Phrynosoma platyrhinos TaxID=52577 RepID=A0ABQ7TFB6_PHRPL|nr:hypothetical protein JD844_008860 [Phrynosoma platyrhinos]
MSVNETESEIPRFFVGGEDVDELLDRTRSEEFHAFYDHEDEDEEYDSPPERQIVVGICSMAKKSQSKPMNEILERLSMFKYITVVIFEEDVILNEPVENWPLCDCLISFHSKGFPLDKAVAYSILRNPFLINDLNMQYHIQDRQSIRREVYSILEAEGILLPRYAVLNRDPNNPQECNLIEGEDHVEVNGEIFQKPFVEKPVSAEDHNVYIYYPTSAGGGSQRLFRKIGSRSSVYSPESNVRKTGSYIYEEFMPTDGTDVKQTVCGFDLLRANGQSYVCDVNGFSFVKNSMKYYDDCAKILGNIVMRELAPQFQIPWSIPLEAEDIPIVPTTSGTMMELRCVIAVIRHGDRTPKQKMKMEVKHQRFFDLFEKCNGYKSGKLKLKKPKQLQEVLDIARQLLIELGQNNDSEIEESKSKLEQLKTVLEMYGHFSGINRKVQLTYLPHGCPKTSSEEEDNRKQEPSLLLVLKWGGELTPAGRVQAEELGRAFRCMYPGGQGDYAGFPGCGLLRLHSTYRHDLKIYASDEGRVQMTAAAFAKGLLALEGELTPILVQMVKSANMNGLLDSDSDSLSSCQHRVKARLNEILQRDRDFTSEDYEKLTPSGSISLIKSMQIIKNPIKTCDKVYSLIQSLTSQIRQRMEDPKFADIQLYHSETLELMLRRWAKLEKDFKTKNGRYDISKIPDIYDCIKYDVQHNISLKLENTMELYRLSKALADIVIPQASKDEQWKRAMDYLNVVSELNYMTQIVIMLYEDPNKEPSSEERFHVELHFSPGAKGCEEDKNLPSGFGYRPASRENDGSKKTSHRNDSDEELHAHKRDETDRAIMMFKPMVSDPIHIHRKSPLPRPRKIGSVEVPPENNSYFRPPRTIVEQKTSSIGSHCASLLSTSVLGGSSSAPNLQDYARTHRKKLTSSGCIDDTTRGSAVKRFSISFARHPTNGFELYSMVPSICPLETLHNSLSLKQVDEFLASITAYSSCENLRQTSAVSLRSPSLFDAMSSRKQSLNTYTPAKIQPTPVEDFLGRRSVEKSPSYAIVPDLIS